MEFTEREFMPVILGADITAYSLARSFHEEYNIKSLVISQKRAKIISESEIIENRVIDGIDDEAVLVKNLLLTGREFKGRKKLILLGCGDFYVRNFVENKDVLEEYFIIPYVDKSLMDKIVLKDNFYKICDELNIPHPKTYVYDLKGENDLKFDFGYPVIAKPANSALYHYAKFPGKKKVFKFNSRGELEDMLKNLKTSSYDYKFLIQDFIPGNDSFMRVLTCYSDKNGKVKFASLGHSLLEDHTSSAIGNPVAIINEYNEKVIDDAKRFLEYTGYTGFSNFDIKYDTRDGAYKFFEINTRLGRSNYYVTGSGYNTVKWIVDDLIYDKELEYTVADRENLFTVVPKSIILHYLDDEALIKKVKELWKSGKVAYPLYYKPDRNLKRSVYVALAYLNQFRKYYKTEKNEKRK